MSEEMKMILALMAYLNLEIKINGGIHDGEEVNATHFARDKSYEYAYTVTAH